MKDLALKYGCNPNQKPSRIFVNDGRDLPIEVLSGRSEGCDRPSVSDILQACLPGRRCSRPSAQRCAEEDLFCG